jgi:gamma-glutamyl:cysteine ligase YbdK (ATP-grasp superfamily)
MHGTLEIRIADQPTDIAHTAAFVAVLRALCAWGAEQDVAKPDTLRRVIYDQNRWAAARFGPRATLVHPEGTGGTTVAELWRELVERIGVDPGLDVSACEGDTQLEIGRRDGLDAATADLVARSVA